jgi:DNA-binding MarR family transcriptional regulator
MSDQPERAIPYDNIRGLAQDLIDELDRRGDVHRRGSRFEHVRRSDVRVWAYASRKPRTMAEIARALKVTRQAVHASVKRLLDLGIVELLPQPGNGRDKLLTVTERGLEAQKLARHSIGLMEEEAAQIIGQRGLDQFRQQLLALVTALRAREVPGEHAVTEDEDVDALPEPKANIRAA